MFLKMDELDSDADKNSSGDQDYMSATENNLEEEQNTTETTKVSEVETTINNNEDNITVDKQNEIELNEIIEKEINDNIEDNDTVDVPKPKRKCPSCDELFTDHYYWLKHVESAHGPKHNCPVNNCYYRTAHKWYMKRHFEQTHGKNAIKCTVDGCQGFFVKRCMKKHIQTAHKNKDDIKATKLKKLINECEYCCYKSSKTKEFECHVRDYHLIGFICPIDDCNEKLFVDKIDLHFKALHPTRRYRYKLGKGLKVYHQEVLNEEDEFVITDTPTEKEDEEMIFIAGNDDKDSYTCPKCKKNFRNRRNLVKHVANVHEKRYKPTTRIKKHTCSFDGCKKSFTTEGLLKDHENFHNKNYEYKCHLCSDEFFARSRLAVHLKKYHLISIKDVDTLKVVKNNDGDNGVVAA